MPRGPPRPGQGLDEIDRCLRGHGRDLGRHCDQLPGQGARDSCLQGSLRLCLVVFRWLPLAACDRAARLLSLPRRLRHRCSGSAGGGSGAPDAPAHGHVRQQWHGAPSLRQRPAILGPAAPFGRRGELAHLAEEPRGPRVPAPSPRWLGDPGPAAAAGPGRRRRAVGNSEVRPLPTDAGMRDAHAHVQAARACPLPASTSCGRVAGRDRTPWPGEAGSQAAAAPGAAKRDQGGAHRPPHPRRCCRRSPWAAS
mmetsp:Transcript_22877/g.72441  ORF Transcript_22877/g.72441 Transcript_22877/m.72441 type:complete len:252 (+) Transcript_22877:268-1023(+)